ncbi:MAG: hypothetical protein QOK34_74, partial [Gaiellaceae bacterium]|nr:hypothetical protein [Gaiellaceae bacterium]
GGDIHQSVGSTDLSLAAPVSSVGTGSSQNHADQARRQNVAGGDEQTQIDPTRCCGVSQLGGQNNREDVNQDTSQKSDGALSSQDLTLIGQCHVENGLCFITQHARNDEDHASFNCGSPGDTPCATTETTHCDAGRGGEAGTFGQCVTPDDIIPSLTAGIMSGTSILPETPLSGFEITMGLVPIP